MSTGELARPLSIERLAEIFSAKYVFRYAHRYPDAKSYRRDWVKLHRGEVELGSRLHKRILFARWKRIKHRSSYNWKTIVIADPISVLVGRIAKPRNIARAMAFYGHPVVGLLLDSGDRNRFDLGMVGSVSRLMAIKPIARIRMPYRILMRYYVAGEFPRRNI